MFICICHAITERKLKEIIRKNDVSEIEDLNKYIKIGDKCGKCIFSVNELINKINKEKEQDK